jgi:hypothetical protein
MPQLGFYAKVSTQECGGEFGDDFLEAASIIVFIPTYMKTCENVPRSTSLMAAEIKPEPASRITSPDWSLSELS